MNSPAPVLSFNFRAIALVLCALVAAPCSADESAEASIDTNAYQLLQLLNQNEMLSSEIARLRGQIEELIENAERTRESQNKIAVDFDTRIAKIEAKPETDTSEDKARIVELEKRMQQLEEAITAMHEVVKSATQASVEMSASETIYESALEKYQAGEYAAAILDFRALLELYGEDPLAPNAQYWLAEALLREGAYDSAIMTGENLLYTHPNSQKVPDTMFLLGKAHLELGDATGARSAWEELVATHPDSNSAIKAQGLLEQLP